MKHRRRYNTQLSKKKSNRTQYNSPYETTSSNSAKFWRYFFILTILVAGTYYIIKYFPTKKSTDDDIYKSEIVKDETPIQPEKQEAFPIEEKQVVSPPLNRVIQLEVLNGCGTQGVAKIFSTNLKRHKYDVVSSGNYLKKGKTFWKVVKTKVIDNTGNRENAEKLAEIIGIKKSNIESKVVASPIADITIVIGKDYRDLAIIKKK